MNFIDDDRVVKQLYPFTLTKCIADLRIGILTLREKWAVSGITDSDTPVPSNLLLTIPAAEALKAGGDAGQLPGALFIHHPWHIFQYNDVAIRHDMQWLTANRASQPIPASNRVTGEGNIFLEEGARVEHAILNAASGPIYIGRNAEIMEGCLVRGPFALCEGAVLKMGAKVYGATTIGPYCVAGGEIKNSVMAAYSNKAHDGYLGDSVIGEWCNLGGGTTNSNIKNTAGSVNVWNLHANRFINAGIKCGIFMGDYSRCAINTAFNTGTVTGVCCNIFGSGLTPKHIPSFSWGMDAQTPYHLDKALLDIDAWKRFKHQLLTEKEKHQLKHLFEHHQTPIL